MSSGAPAENAYGLLGTTNLATATERVHASLIGKERRNPSPPVSDAGSLAGRADDFAMSVANELLASLKAAYAQQHLDAIRLLLPDKLRDFALRIGFQGETQRHRDIMWVAHNATSAIIRCFEGKATEIDITYDDDEGDDGQGEKKSGTDGEFDAVVDKMQHVWDRGDPVSSADNGPAEEYEGVPLRPIEIDPYFQTLHSSSAFSWLINDIRRDNELSAITPDVMHSMRKEILQPFYDPNEKISRWRKPLCVEISFILEWNPLVFMAAQANEHSPSDHLAGVITLTGNAGVVQALTCFEYMSQTWPSTGAELLGAIEQVIGQPRKYHQTAFTDGTQIEISIEDDAVRVTATGVICSIAEVGQQLAWLGAALQCPPESGGGSICRATAHLTELGGFEGPSSRSKPASAEFRITFSITALSPFSIPQELGSCWHDLFHGFVIAEGFPVLNRPRDCVGLDVPLGMAAALTSAPRVVEFGGCLCIKGFSTLMYPTKVSKDVVVWHLICNIDGTRIAYSDERVDKGSNLSERLRYADLERGRHVIGWCDKVASYTGHPGASLDITYSWLDKPGDGLAMDKLEISAGQYIVAQGSFSLHKKDKAVSIQRDNLDYFAKIEWINKKLVVLHDVGYRIAWLVDGPSALLHLVRTSLYKDAKGDFNHLHLFEQGRVEEADPLLSFTGRRASINILTNEHNLQLPVRRKRSRAGTESGTDETYTFQDRVEDIFGVLEQIIDHQEDMRSRGVGLLVRKSPWRQFEGFDFLDLANRSDPLQPKAIKLCDDGEGWNHFVREIKAVVLFGRGFGDLLRPLDSGSSCVSCFWNIPAPRGRDLLAVAVRDLERLKIWQDHHGEQRGGWILMGQKTWSSPGRAFDACACVTQSPSPRVQTLQGRPKTSRERHTEAPPSNVRTEGAVLFGMAKSALHSRWNALAQTGGSSSSAGSSRPLFTLPNVSISEAREAVDSSSASSNQTSLLAPSQSLSAASGTSPLSSPASVYLAGLAVSGAGVSADSAFSSSGPHPQQGANPGKTDVAIEQVEEAPSAVTNEAQNHHRRQRARKRKR